MKFKNYLFIFAAISLLVLSFNFVSSTVAVTYNLSDAIIEANGLLNISNSLPVSGVYVEGYVCTAVNCTSLGSKIAGLSTYSSGNKITVVYPNNLASSYGYLLYFHKEGFIGWEQKSTYSSPDNNNYYINSSKVIYLSQKRSGYSPIQNLYVVNEVHPYLPLEIGFNATIDADTYYSITRRTSSNLTLNETVETKVLLEILSGNQVIYNSVKTLNIPYSGMMPVKFVYDGFNASGMYTIKLTTNITDAKILNPSTRSVNSQVNVIPQGLTNYSFSLLNGLNATPVYPLVNQTVNFTFEVSSHYLDVYGILINQSSLIEVLISKNSTLVENFSYTVPYGNSSSFSRNFSLPGIYNICVTALPANPQGNLTLNTTSCLSLTVNFALIYDPSNPSNGTNQTIPGNDTDDDDDNDDFVEDDERDSNNARALSSVSLPLEGNSTIVLSPRVDLEKRSYKIILYWLIIAILAILILIVLIYLVKFIK